MTYGSDGDTVIITPFRLCLFATICGVVTMPFGIFDLFIVPAIFFLIAVVVLFAAIFQMFFGEYFIKK